MIRFDEEEIKYLAVELPDEIKFFKYSGDFEGERAAIAAYQKKDIPFALKRRLDIEDVIASERDLVEPLVRLVPLACLKG